MTDLSDPRWAALDRSRQILVERFGHAGVVGAEWVVPFTDEWDTINVWLKVSTDRERNTLGDGELRRLGDPPGTRRALDRERETYEPMSAEHLDDVVTACLTEVGVLQPPGRARVVVQSQESVDRDYEGSWF